MDVLTAFAAQQPAFHLSLLTGCLHFAALLGVGSPAPFNEPPEHRGGGMWTPWNSNVLWIGLAAFGWTSGIAITLGLVAYRLPKILDDSLIPSPVAVHRKRHFVFYLASLAVAAWCVWRFEATLAAALMIVCALVLLTLAWIDAETGFLPDALTLPLLWLGLLTNVHDTFVPLSDAVIGAAGGYAFLWLLGSAYMLLAGRQGMGHGDMKLVSALGAWLGWMPLAKMVFMACVLAIGVVAIFARPKRSFALMKFSFGPYLVAAALIVLLFR